MVKSVYFPSTQEQVLYDNLSYASYKSALPIHPAFSITWLHSFVFKFEEQEKEKRRITSVTHNHQNQHQIEYHQNYQTPSESTII